MLSASRIKDLVNDLNYYKNEYYNNNNNVISDREYDELFDELKHLEESTGIVYPNSPTQTVGFAVVSKLDKVKHTHPLLSLDKVTNDVPAFASYFDGNPVMISAKMDGLTASLTYKHGQLVRAESRGDGEIGEDITHSVKTFTNVPLIIPDYDDVVVDGECIIDYATFEELNQTSTDKQYANPRNLVSGTVRLLDSSIVASRKPKFIAWRLHQSGSNYADRYDSAFAYLSKLGFEVVPHKFVLASHDWESDMSSAIEECKDICNQLNYPIDGVVGAFNDRRYGDSLGLTSHHPKGSIAFKFYQDRQETCLLDIEWAPSRTGLINPVAIVDPVEIDGTIVSRASLCNISIIKELEIGIGDTVNIIKANQIIPQITENLTRSNTYVIPTVCPCCGYPAVVRNSSGREMLYCENVDCDAVRIDQFVNFVSKDGLDIEGLSIETIKLFYEEGLIHEFSDTYCLCLYEDIIRRFDRFGNTSVDKLFKSINKSKTVKFSKLLTALGIPGIGKSTAKIIADCVKENTECTSKLFHNFCSMCNSNYDWSVLEGIGTITSDAINRHVNFHLGEYDRLCGYLRFSDVSSATTNTSALAGKKICITGKLLKYSNRDSLVADIEEAGGRCVSSVSSDTDYLINNDVNSTSSKNKAAQKHGTVIITDSEIYKMIHSEDPPPVLGESQDTVKLKTKKLFDI